MSPADPNEFREDLFVSQPMTPALREGYRRELDAILYQTHTARSRALAITLLVICLGVVAGEIRALLVYPGSFSFYVGAATMLLACAVTAVWVARDLFRPRAARARAFKVAELFYGAASILLCATLLSGLRAPSDPASTFNVLFIFAFFAVCTNWAFASRITAAELAAREQTLRLETRLADLASRLPKP